MKIGIISDTHENVDAIRWAITYFNDMKIDFMIHLGDIISPIMQRYFSELKSNALYIYGNNDGEKRFLKEKFNTIFEPPYEIELDNKKILLTHKPLNWNETIEKYNPDFILYGHTHKIDFEIRKKTVIFNPGEACGLLTGEKSVAILNTSKREIMLVRDDGRKDRYSY